MSITILTPIRSSEDRQTEHQNYQTEHQKKLSKTLKSLGDTTAPSDDLYV